MKKISFALSLLTAAFALTNCAKEASIDVKDVEGSEFVIYATDIKTTNDGVKTKWAAGDEIGVYHAVAGSTEYVKDGKFTISEEDLEKGAFKGNVSGLEADKEYDWYVIYPYNSYTKDPKNEKNPSDQPKNYTQVGALFEAQDGVNSTAHLNGDLCPLVALGSTSGLASPELAFSNVACVFELNVANDFGKDVEVKTVELCFDNGATEKALLPQVCGTYFIDFSNESGPVCTSSSDPERGKYYTSNLATLNVTNGELASGATGKFNIVLNPVTFAAGTKLTKTVHFVDGEDAPYVKVSETTISAETAFKSGVVYPGDITLAGATSEEVLGLSDVIALCPKKDDKATVNSVVPVTVFAIGGQYAVIADEETMMVAYYGSPNDIKFKVGDVLEIKGEVTNYKGTVEFSNPTVSVIGSGSVELGNPNEFNKGEFDTIGGLNSIPVTYYTVSGEIDNGGYIKDDSGWKVRFYGYDAKYTGKKVVVNCLSFGYNSTSNPNYVQALVVSETLDPSFKDLVISPAGNKTWAYDEIDSYEVIVEVNGGEYTFTPSAGLDTWLDVSSEGNVYTFTPKGQNTSGSNNTGTVTFTHSDDPSLTKVITLSQACQGGSVVIPGTYDIPTNNALWKTSYSGTYTPEKDLEATQDNIKLVLKNGTSSNGYIKDTETRAYNGYNLEISVPEGYVITNVTFAKTMNGSTPVKWDGDPNVDGITLMNGVIWNGQKNPVVISFTKTCSFCGVSVTYYKEGEVPQKELKGIEIFEEPKTSYKPNDFFDPAGLTINKIYTDDSKESLVYGDDTKDKFSFTPSLSTPLTLSDNKVTITYEGKSVDLEITVKEGGLDAGTILWSETWTGSKTSSSKSDDSTPSANYGKGTTVYNSGTVTYTQTDNTVYVRNEKLSGGDAPELMITSGKTWTISDINVTGSEELSLTYKSNNAKSSVSCTGATISGSSGSYTINTKGVKTISLTFNCSGNTRIDDVLLKVTK